MPSQQEVRWSQLKIGVIVLVSVVILTMLLFLMTSASGLGLFSRKLTVTTYFENAGGLKVGAAVEVHVHLALGDAHVGGGIDEVAEDVARLRLSVAAHAPREQAVESARDHQERHIEIHFEADRRGQRIHVEEAHRVG